MYCIAPPRPHRANYMFTERHGRLLVFDLCMPRAPSVTNDVERVIADFVAMGFDLAKKRLFYQDSMRQWAEIVTDGDNQFVGFEPVEGPDDWRD